MPDGGLHYPALVLNADFRPLSYFPLSVWSWQDAVKAVFLNRVSVLSEYEDEVHSPSMSMRLPSVIALKDHIPAARKPAFTRFNVFLRDAFSCQYCGDRYPMHDLTFDHVVPRSRGGRTTWGNILPVGNIAFVWNQWFSKAIDSLAALLPIVKVPQPVRCAP